MTLAILLAHPAVQALGRALLHFAWQGAVLALVLWIVKAAAPPLAARFRYGAASLIMLMMPLALIVTAARGTFGEDQPRNAVNLAAVNQVSLQSPAIQPQLVFDAPMASAPRPGISGWVVCIWIVGVLLLSVRATGGWFRAHKLKRGATPAGAELQDTLRRLKLGLSVSVPVRLCTSALVRVPIAIGWLQPYILLPVTALTGLNESQIRAVLAHELAHIRRHDYLMNLLQTAIETLLFYHPAVWWVGKQIRMEREHCCDDLAVAVCGSALEYAGALAEMEHIRNEIPEPALAASGGDLLGRIRRLLGGADHASRSSGTTIAAAALALLIVGATTAISMHAAPQESQQAFEVASVKRDVSGEPGPVYYMFPAFTARRATLRDLVTTAYEVYDFQVSGGPGWINSERYNIESKSEGEPSAPSRSYRTLQLRRLQTLLRDRFKLALHRETKELRVYELTVAKSGLKLRPLREGSCIGPDPKNALPSQAKNPADYCGAVGIDRRGRYQAGTASMKDVADALTILLGRTVVDKTGITGTFRIELTFTPDVSTVPAEDAGSPGGPAGAASPTDRGPNIFTALQEQLGLKLESGKGLVEVLVIDNVERASEN